MTRDRICSVCGAPYVLPRKSQRRTCSRACHSALGWRDPDKRQARMEAIIAARRTPESRARSVESNRRRWSRPGEREKLAQWNRERWADPAIKAALTQAIASVWGDELRAHLSAIKAAQWRDPAIRDRYLAGMRAAHRTPQHRRIMSEMMARRWADPAMRDQMIRKLLQRVRSPEFRDAASAWMKARWADPAFKAATLEAAAKGRAAARGAPRRWKMLARAVAALKKPPKARRLALVPLAPAAPEVAKRLAANRNVEGIRRRCLTCEQAFISKHAGNRMCETCRMAAA